MSTWDDPYFESRSIPIDTCQIESPDMNFISIITGLSSETSQKVSNYISFPHMNNGIEWQAKLFKEVYCGAVKYVFDFDKIPYEGVSDIFWYLEELGYKKII